MFHSQSVAITDVIKDQSNPDVHLEASFLRIPVEIRLTIYRFVLTDVGTTLDVLRRKISPLVPPGISLLAVNRKVREEVLPIIFGENTVRFQVGLEHLLIDVPVDMFRNLRRVEIVGGDNDLFSTRLIEPMGVFLPLPGPIPPVIDPAMEDYVLASKDSDITKIVNLLRSRSCRLQEVRIIMEYTDKRQGHIFEIVKGLKWWWTIPLLNVTDRIIIDVRSFRHPRMSLKPLLLAQGANGFFRLVTAEDELHKLIGAVALRKNWNVSFEEKYMKVARWIWTLTSTPDRFPRPPVLIGGVDFTRDIRSALPEGESSKTKKTQLTGEVVDKMDHEPC